MKNNRLKSSKLQKNSETMLKNEEKQTKDMKKKTLRIIENYVKNQQICEKNAENRTRITKKC